VQRPVFVIILNNVQLSDVLFSCKFSVFFARCFSFAGRSSRIEGVVKNGSVFISGGVSLFAEGDLLL
jgi:hypothetical protein